MYTKILRYNEIKLQALQSNFPTFKLNQQTFNIISNITKPYKLKQNIFSYIPSHYTKLRPYFFNSPTKMAAVAISNNKQQPYRANSREKNSAREKIIPYFIRQPGNLENVSLGKLESGTKSPEETAMGADAGRSARKAFRNLPIKILNNYTHLFPRRVPLSWGLPSGWGSLRPHGVPLFFRGGPPLLRFPLERILSSRSDSGIKV